MQFLSTLFPTHTRRTHARTVVHAGPLLLSRSGGTGALRRFLRIPRKRELILVHHGQERLHQVAEEAGVLDVTVDASTQQEAAATTEMALDLGARRLDFSIDEPGVPGSDGATLREIGLREAEALARNPSVRPRIRAKLRAGVAAVREGVARVRIGNPEALIRNRATVLLPEATAALGKLLEPPAVDAPGEAAGGAGAPCPQPQPVAARARRRIPLRHPAIANAAVYSPRTGRCERPLPSPEPGARLRDSWWRLPERPSPGSAKRLLAC